MITKRENIFETNSSSTHCLVVIPTKDYEKQFKLNLNKSGKITVSGWDQMSEYTAYGFYEKLAYMLSWMYLRENDNPYWDDNDVIREDFEYPSDNFNSCYADEYDTILKVIQKHYPEVTGIRLVNISDINWDHQTMPHESDFIIEIYNEEQVEGYLFNDSAIVRVGRD